MTHEDKGRYFLKHPGKITVEQSLKQEIIKRSLDNKISCSAAAAIARKKKVTMSEVGMAIDILNLSITKCQIGLFGHDEKKKIAGPVKNIEPGLREAIINALINDKLPCKSAWEIAAAMKISRLTVGNACDTLKIKIKPCQLGAF
ncbi:MAG TPA: hypothetical protein PKZ12_03720 [Smithellaceae bacterium]|nr:hypothetical protein [Smithellaceae bacterium]